MRAIITTAHTQNSIKASDGERSRSYKRTLLEDELIAARKPAEEEHLHGLAAIKFAREMFSNGPTSYIQGGLQPSGTYLHVGVHPDSLRFKV